MLIKRDVYFSAVDTETGEERLFSVREILSEEEYLERLYSEGEGKKRKKLSEVDSKKGLKRTIITAPITNGGSVAGYLTDSVADKLDEEGKSDSEILKGTKKAGLKRGAAVGAAVGAGLGVTRGISGAVKGATMGAALGAVGGHCASGVRTRDRLRKRSGSV